MVCSFSRVAPRMDRAQRDAGKYAGELRHNVVTAGFAAASGHGIILWQVVLSAAVMTAKCGDFNNNDHAVAQGS
jgi:hypothetical protein